MSITQKSILILSLLGVFIIIYVLKPILGPFLVGFLIAYLGDPAVDRLEAIGLGRSAAAALVLTLAMLILVAAVLILMPLLIRQTIEFIEYLPELMNWLQTRARPLAGSLLGIDLMHIEFDQVRDQLLTNWKSAGGVIGQVVAEITQSGIKMIAWIANVALVPVVAFYLLRDWDRLVANIRNLLPRRIVDQTGRVVTECDEVLGSFLRGQLLIMLLLGCIYAGGLWVVGLNMALIIGFVAGLASLVPYLGFIVGLAAATLAALFQFQEVMPLVYVVVVFGLGQLLEGMVLTPWLMGERIGLHPVAIIFAILAGGQLFGFVGILLALPVAAVIMVFLRHVHESYKESDLYETTESSQ